MKRCIMTSPGSIRHIVLTGPPGVGKTTLTQKVCLELQHRKISVKGFYTSELREGGRRIGFDVISLDGNAKPLARIGEGVGPRVGQYMVQVQSFESVALPILKSSTVDEGVLVIDEVGKMELFSKHFEKAVKEVFSGNSTILATIPLQKGKPMVPVELIRSHPYVRVVTVDFKNRDHLVSEIANHFASILKGTDCS